MRWRHQIRYFTKINFCLVWRALQFWVFLVSFLKLLEQFYVGWAKILSIFDQSLNSNWPFLTITFVFTKKYSKLHISPAIFFYTVSVTPSIIMLMFHNYVSNMQNCTEKDKGQGSDFFKDLFVHFLIQSVSINCARLFWSYGQVSINYARSENLRKSWKFQEVIGNCGKS